MTEVAGASMLGRATAMGQAKHGSCGLLCPGFEGKVSPSHPSRSPYPVGTR